MSEKFKVDDESICGACMKPIKFQGKYWVHTTCCPRHPATPKDGLNMDGLAKQAQKDQEDYRINENAKKIGALVYKRITLSNEEEFMTFCMDLYTQYKKV